VILEIDSKPYFLLKDYNRFLKISFHLSENLSIWAFFEKEYMYLFSQKMAKNRK